jgi:antitoxin CptB
MLDHLTPWSRPRRDHPETIVMSEPITVRRKRLIYRSRYRGILESDMLLGRFADRYVATMDDVQLDRYEALLEESDPDLLAWIAGAVPVPAHHDHGLFRLLQSFEPADRRDEAEPVRSFEPASK